MNLRRLGIVSTVGILSTLSLTTLPGATAVPTPEDFPLFATSHLLGGYVVGVAGDPDGNGTIRANILLKDANNVKLCVLAEAEDLAPITSITLHPGKVGQVNPAIITITNTQVPFVTVDDEQHGGGCVTVPFATIAPIADHPNNYYIQFNTGARIPAVRGQVF